MNENEEFVLSIIIHKIDKNTYRTELKTGESDINVRKALWLFLQLDEPLTRAIKDTCAMQVNEFKISKS